MGAWLAKTVDGEQYIGLFVAPNEDSLFDAIDQFVDPYAAIIRPIQFGGIELDRKWDEDAETWGAVCADDWVNGDVAEELAEDEGWRFPKWSLKAKRKMREAAETIASSWHDFVEQIPMPARSLAERCVAKADDGLLILHIDPSFLPMASASTRRRLADEIYRLDAAVRLNFADEVE